MLKYIVRRILMLIPVLFLVSVIIFSVIHLIPGDPVGIMLGTSATPAARAALIKELGLDKPLPVQYVDWVWNIMHGSFGRSVLSQSNISDLIVQALPATLILVSAAMLITIAISIPAGVYSAIKRDSKAGTAILIFSQVGVSVPNFVWAISFILIFAVALRLFPAYGYSQSLGDPLRSIQYLTLPALSLALTLIAFATSVVRSSVLDTLKQDFVRTAYAKGLQNRVVILKHVLRNSMIPAVTVLGLQFGSLLAGAVVIEEVFAWPGIGRLLVESIFDRDYPTVQACALVIAGIFLLVNLIVDVVYSYLNPKIHYE
jgi:peptide/nickel transport system permease protein